MDHSSSLAATFDPPKIPKSDLPKSAVGREITTRVPTVSPQATVEEVRALLPGFARKTASINYLYVLNDKGKLVGVFSIQELMRQPLQTQIKDMMTRDLVVSRPRLDRERAVHLAIKHNLKAVPIVDDQQHLLGILSNDKLISVLYEEYREDINRLGGIVAGSDNFDTILDQGIWKAFLSRLPWIMLGLLGGMLAAQVIELFEGTLSLHLALAAFIPLILYISTAVCIQTQTFFIRDLAFNSKLAILPYTLKQLATTALIGLACGATIWGLVGVFWGESFLGFVIGLATFTTIASSAVIAVAIPHLLFRFKQDPASGSGPFATIVQDLLSIVIYLSIASVLL